MVTKVLSLLSNASFLAKAVPVVKGATMIGAPIATAYATKKVYDEYKPLIIIGIGGVGILGLIFILR